MSQVKRAYLIDINPFCFGLVRRVLISEHGSVFIRGYGWVSLDFLQESGYKILALPGNVEHGDWPGEGWWTFNWKLPDWGWLYTSTPKEDFQPCRRSFDNGSFIYSAG